jgi:hypothetical protein
MKNPQMLIQGPDGWWIAPEGAVIHVQQTVAVIADVHLGYEWARGSAGDMVPSHSLRQTIERLSSLISHTTISRLIVAGDLVESPKPCRRTTADLISLENWLQSQDVTLVRILGNHDAWQESNLPLEIEVAGWTVTHGHLPTNSHHVISGHDHPVLKHGRTSARCCLVGPKNIILPAFSENAAGLNVAGRTIPRQWRNKSLSCFASVDKEVFDFGPIEQLVAKFSLIPT